jgi:predicted phosphodiesterase
MRYAILSDIHGRRKKLETVLADAETRRVDRFISLGDVGADDCLTLLQEVGAMAVFGNYEVSGWRRLAPSHRAWVRGWPALLAEDGFLAVHAVPWWPNGLQTVKDFDDWLKGTGRPWRSLFPYLTEDEDALWQVLAELENSGKAILFHGHTHQQTIWSWGTDGRLRRVRAAIVTVKPGHYYSVGVGSVGFPEDGSWATYALYDTAGGEIRLIRLKAPDPSSFPT